MRTVVFKDPRILRPHPLNRTIPRLQQGMLEWLAMRDDVEERGVQEPLEVFGDLVVDGETRRGIAASLDMESVPCVEITGDEVLTTIRKHLILQKHLTKGQRAYLLIPHVAGLAKESAARRIDNIKKGCLPNPTESDSGKHWDFEEFCRANGFSRDLGEQARTLHEIFNGNPTTLRSRNLEKADPQYLRETWEPKILDLNFPIGLGAALAGIAGEQATKEVAKLPNGDIQLELFQEGTAAIDRVAKAWPKMRTADRPKIIQAWKRLTLAWPPEMRRELGTALLDGTESGQ